jgi:thioredoxin-dependent peroxiredoxin
MMILDNIWLILFILWGLPLTVYRSKFRKMVYRTDSWTINIKPVFGKELKAIFGNIFPYDKKYIKMRNFYRFYLLVYLLLFTAHISFGNSSSKEKNMEIKIGSTIPDIVLQNQNGELFDLKKETKGKNVVLYFYPKDDTPGCTAQACSFRDQFEDFTDANAVVIGISGQSVESHKEFADKHRLTFTLLSDKDNKIRKKFGVPTNFLGLIPGRVTYVINKENKVVYIFNSQTKVEEHVSKTLEILKQGKTD